MTEDLIPAATPSRRIKELEVMVADVVIETPDTTTLVLFTGNDRLEYSAGHFLTIDPHQFEGGTPAPAALSRDRARPSRADRRPARSHQARILRLTASRPARLRLPRVQRATTGNTGANGR